MESTWPSARLKDDSGHLPSLRIFPSSKCCITVSRTPLPCMPIVYGISNRKNVHSNFVFSSNQKGRECETRPILSPLSCTLRLLHLISNWKGLNLPPIVEHFGHPAVRLRVCSLEMASTQFLHSPQMHSVHA
jgi:hypothetical protein